jgi:hypothetical protein
MATGFMEGDSTGPEVRTILVRCTVNPCSETTGTGDTVITYADGTTSTGGWNYQN